MEKIDLTNVQEQKESKRIVAGGYIAQIKSCYDNKEKQYLEMELDIIDGEYKGYYQDLFTMKGFWGLKYWASYKETALGMFKSFVTKVNESNVGLGFQDTTSDEKSLIGKSIGIVLGAEEYVGNDGANKVRLKVAKVLSVDDIKNGNFTIPELKTLAPAVVDTTMVDDGADSDLPF